jgi:HPP family
VLYFPPPPSNKRSRDTMVQNQRNPRHLFERFKLAEDYRGRLPLSISRFLGYRPPGSNPPFDPLPFPPFTWLHKIPLKYEVWLFSWIGGFISILLIEAIMSTSTAFRNDYHTPTIIVSFGASAVLLFSTIESPLSQPRNFILGHFFSSLIGTTITRLFVLNGNYQGYLDNSAFHGTVFINGGLSMATSSLVMVMIGAVHPP